MLTQAKDIQCMTFVILLFCKLILDFLYMQSICHEYVNSPLLISYYNLYIIFSHILIKMMDVIAIDLIIGDNVGSTTIQLANVVKKSSNYQHFNLFWIFFFFPTLYGGCIANENSKATSFRNFSALLF